MLRLYKFSGKSDRLACYKVLSISGILNNLAKQYIARSQTHIWLVSVCCLFVRIFVEFFKYISLFLLAYN